MRRIEQFTEYHKNGDGDINGRVLRDYAKRHNLNDADEFLLAYCYSITYCTVSALILMKAIKANKTIDQIAQESMTLIFQSDRHWIKSIPKIISIMQDMKEHIQERQDVFVKYKKSGIIDTDKLIKYVSSWKQYSRYSAFLLVETYTDITDLKMTEIRDFQITGDRMRYVAGLYNVFDNDKISKYIDEHKKLPVKESDVMKKIDYLTRYVRMYGGDDAFVKIETSLCAYHKLFQGTRYDGYYADRQLSELTKYESEGRYLQEIQEIKESRKRCYPARYLGELNNWKGIRKNKQVKIPSNYTGSVLLKEE